MTLNLNATIVGGLMSMIVCLPILISETNGIRVKVDNGHILKPGEKVLTRLNDTLTVLEVKGDTVLFNNFCPAGFLNRLTTYYVTK